MNKNELAQQINCTTDITRVLAFNCEYGFEEGEIYDNRGKAESWSDDSNTQQFNPETSKKYIYVLKCENVGCHKVDYANIEECEILGAEDCKSEGEVLVSADTKMIVTYVSNEGDFEEMGYYTVELEIVE